jgi:D-alanyl-D-alanine carboxypeptidase
MQVAARAGTLAPGDQTDANPSWGWAAGAGISTANDSLRGCGLWFAAACSMPIGKPGASRACGRSIPQSDQRGLWWAIAKFGPLLGHTGELPGYNSFMGHDPDNDVTLVVWTNLAPAVDGHDPATAIARELIGLVYSLAP